MEISGSYQAALSPRMDALPENLEGACKALEKEFALLVFSKMRQALSTDTSSGASKYAKETTAAMLDEQWANFATQGEGLGLWRTMQRQLEAIEDQVGSLRGRLE